MPDRFRDLISERNRATFDSFDDAGPHRAQVTDQLVRGFAGEGRLVVLGAGNCNDLDLPRLAQAFREVHLVDLDGDALAAGLDRQAPPERDRFVLHGGVDVTGIADRLAEWRPESPPADDEIDALLESLREPPDIELPHGADMAASVCLLSQLIEMVVLSLGEQHPRFGEAVAAVRAQHLKLLMGAAAQGKYGLLVTDIVSTDTAPQLATLPDAALNDEIAKLVNAGNCFHGVNPFTLVHLLDHDPELSNCIDGKQLLRPWRWNLGPRVYAVCAIKFRVLPG